MTELPPLPQYGHGWLFFVEGLRSRIFSSQVKAARHFGLSHTTISRYENGLLNPPLGYLAALGRLLIERLGTAEEREMSYADDLLRELNRALRRRYPDEPPLKDWAELESLADAYLTEQRGGTPVKKPPLQPTPAAAPSALPREAWGEAPDVARFYGREPELAELSRWIAADRCRVIGIIGMGGIGKTSLAARLARQLREQFDYVIWWTLRNAPPVEETLAYCLRFLSDQSSPNLPDKLERRLGLLLEHLRRRRCLLIFDNVETVLRPGDRAGHYREGYQEYGQLLRLVGETQHQSCLIMTSREKPREFALLTGQTAPVRLLPLPGLGLPEGRLLLEDRGLSGPPEVWNRLVHQYSGNPLLLKLVAETVVELFDGDIADFLAEGAPIFGGVQGLLDEQFERLSDLEQAMMLWLAIEREAVTLGELARNVVQPVSRQALQDALKGLRRRSLIEKSGTGFTLQNVVMEYLTDQLVDRVYEELADETISLFDSHALVKAEAKAYIRESQTRLILAPLASRLLAGWGREEIEVKLKRILMKLRQSQPRQPGYAAGNILNMLVCLKSDLTGYDFSRLAVRQAYLPGVLLHNVSFAGADLAHSVFMEIFDNILSVTFSPDGRLVAGGTANGAIHSWQIDDGKTLLAYVAHADWVWAVTFSPDGAMLASGSGDQTVRLWDVSSPHGPRIFAGHTGQVTSVTFSPDGTLLASSSDDQTIKLWDVVTGECRKTFKGHEDWIADVAFSPDGRYLASGSHDRTVRVWEIDSGQTLQTLRGHTHGVWSVAFSPDGHSLASGSNDRTIRLWGSSGGRCLRTLAGHTDPILSVAFSPDGQMVASSSDDRTVRLWQVETGRCRTVLAGHASRVWSVAFNPGGRYLASGSDDQTVRLWDVAAGRCVRIFQGHTNWISSLAFSPDGNLLLSGSDDRTMRLWDIATARCLRTTKGHTNWVWSVAFSPDGRLIASGGDDRMVIIWEADSGRLLRNLAGHEDWVRSVAFSPNGRLVASGGADRTIRLWDTATGQPRGALRGHTHRVRSVAFSPDGSVLVSGGDDGTVRLWDADAGCHRQTLPGHTNRVTSVDFSPNGRTIASSSADQTVRLWDTATGQCDQILAGHLDRIWSVVFSPDGRFVASGSCDRTIRVWEAATGACLHVLSGHTDWIRAVVFSPDGRTLASGSHDETIKLWDLRSGVCLQTLRSARPYEGLDITGATGLTEAGKAGLRALGAIEKGE